MKRCEKGVKRCEGVGRKEGERRRREGEQEEEREKDSKEGGKKKKKKRESYPGYSDKLALPGSSLNTNPMRGFSRGFPICCLILWKLFPLLVASR